MARQLKIELVVDDKGSVTVKQFGREMDKLGPSGQKAGRDIGDGFQKAQTGADGFERSLSKVKIGVAVAAAGAVVLAKQVFETSLKMNQLDTSFEAIAGSAAGGAQEMAFLRKTADDLGQEFLSTADAYKGISAAAKGTNLEGEKTRDIFLAVTKASTVLGLSAEQTQGSLLAISQMISKGTVAAEELRGQLGERMPGAFQLASKAMGVSTAELGKMLEQGKIVAEDFLPKFAKAIEDQYGGAVGKASHSATADFNRFKNAVTDAKVALADSGAMDLMIGSLKDFSGFVKDNREEIKEFGKNIVDLAGNIKDTLMPAVKDLLIVLGAMLKTLSAIKEAGALPALMPGMIKGMVKSGPTVADVIHNRPRSQIAAEIGQTAFASDEGLFVATGKPRRAAPSAAAPAKSGTTTKTDTEKKQADKIAQIRQDLADQMEMIGRSEYDKDYILLEQKVRDYENATGDKIGAAEFYEASIREINAKELADDQKKLEKTTEDTRKAAEDLTRDEQQAAETRLSAYREMYRDMRDYGVDDAEFQRELVDLKKQEFIDATDDRVTAEKWATVEMDKYWAEFAKRHGTYTTAMELAFGKYGDSVENRTAAMKLILNDLQERMKQSTSQGVDAFIAGESAKVAVQKAAGDMMVNAAGEISKQFYNAAIEQIVALIGAHIGLGASEAGTTGTSVYEQLANIGIYLAAGVGGMLAGRAMADKFRATGGWIGTHPAGGWISAGSGTRDDVFLGSAGNTRHWGMGGEYIVNKRSAAAYGPMLEAINATGHASGGWINRGYADGGVLAGYNPADEKVWHPAADALWIGAGISAAHGAYVGSWPGAIAELIVWAATALPSMFGGKYLANQFSADGGWIDEGHAVGGSFNPRNWGKAMDPTGIMQQVDVWAEKNIGEKIDTFVRSKTASNGQKIIDALLGDLRGPFHQIAVDLMTPHRYTSDAIANVKQQIQDAGKQMGNATKAFPSFSDITDTPWGRGIPKFHDGKREFPAIIREDERVLSPEETRTYNRRDGGSMRPVHITLTLDGRVLSRHIYNATKRGDKLVHERGITNR